MFTILQKRPNLQAIYTARFVEFLAGDSQNHTEPSVGIYGVPSSHTEHMNLTQGTIYVMNEGGKTVAHYDLKWE